MKLRTRLTLFTVLLVLGVVAVTSFTTVISLRYFLRREMKLNQITWFNNFRRACEDALRIGDDLAIQAFSESLEKSVPELAYAVFVDESRGGVLIGGIESLHRFKKIDPGCPPARPGGPGAPEPYRDIAKPPEERWRSYCHKLVQTNIRGEPIRGTVYLGFNMNILETKLGTIVGRMWTTLLWAMLAVLAVGLAVALLLEGRLTRRVLKLTEGAKALGEGHLDTQIPVESSDELGFLAQEFNLMAMKLKELDQLKDDFVSSVSHELRSPLSAISGYVELLQSKPLEEIAGEKRVNALRIIQESTARLTHFINDILDLAKLKAGIVEIHPKSLHIGKVAEEVVGLFQPLFDKKGVQASSDIPGNIPTIEADEEKVRQVLTNLISNALKFTASGGKIRIMARNQTEFIQVSVEDTGIGVREESREEIFERFKQVKDAKGFPTGQKGTGLGLAIAKGNVEAHGGRIWIESEIGKGTAVHFTLPNWPVRSPGIPVFG